jgi:hypothetical protein
MIMIMETGWYKVTFLTIILSSDPNFMGHFYVTVIPNIMGRSYVLSLMGLSYVPETPF